MKTRRLLIVLLVALTIGVGGDRVARAEEAASTCVPVSSGSSTAKGPLTALFNEASTGCDITCITADGNIGVNRPCDLTDFVNLFVYLAQWAMSLVAILAVGMMIYGGFQFITAGGRASKIESGKQVMAGTITGVIISLAAYVIINSVVAAFTNTTTKSLNFFAGPIATVFGNNKEYVKPFSGSGSGEETRGNNCRSSNNTDWDKDCSDHIYCADTGETGGTIANYQNKLNSMDCGCNAADGCYGPDTVDCVRRFQIANKLSPTGMIDSSTSKALDINVDNLVHCNSSTNVSEVMAKLPAATYPNTTGGTASDVGCCVVKSATEDYYYLDNMTRQNCTALGADSYLETKNTYCPSALTVGTSGYCSDPGNPQHCFQQVSKYWCENVAHDTFGRPLIFKPNRCDNQCTLCKTAVMSLPPDGL